jgi:hypothetical protein
MPYKYRPQKMCMKRYCPRLDFDMSTTSYNMDACLAFHLGLAHHVSDYQTFRDS